jgi:hypothetical protein
MLIPESIEHVAARDATPTIPSTSLEELRRALPEEAADLRLNLQSVLWPTPRATVPWRRRSRRRPADTSTPLPSRR